MNRNFKLQGPPADNLLGFLSIIGLVVALDKVTKLRPKIAWEERIAHLYVDSDSNITENDIVKYAITGISKFAKDMKFPFPDLKIGLDDQHKLQKEYGVAVALGSDASPKKTKDRTIASRCTHSL